MSRLTIGLCSALFLLVVLIVLAPARLIVSVVPVEQLLMQGVSGTLWNGSASRSLVSVQGGYLHLGQLRWSLAPLSLLTLSPSVVLESSWGAQRFSGEVSYRTQGSFELSAVDALLPAALVKQLVPLELSGEFSLQLQQLVVDQGETQQGAGRLVWQNAGWISPQGRRPLGTYVIDFEQLPGQSLLGEVITLDGDVLAAGSVVLTGRTYKVDVLMSGPGLADPQLKQALQLVAAPEGDGFRVKLEGAF